MREFKTAFGGPVDLDDPATYCLLPQELTDVLNRLFQEVGFASVYVRAHNFSDFDSGRKQIERVNKLVDEIIESVQENPWKKSCAFWQEKLFIFLDEIENMS